MADWYRWFPALYELDTAHLTLAEHGAYRRLLDKYMMLRCPLPDNDRALAAFCGCSLDEWLSVAANVRAFFRPNSGKLFHKRCDQELDWQDAKTEVRSEVGKKGAEARWAKYNGLDASSMPKASFQHAEGIAKNARGEEKRRDNIGTATPARATPEPKPLPDPGIKSAADAVAHLKEALLRRNGVKADLDPAARKARWQQRVFAHAKACLSDAEYQRLVTEAANDTPEGQAWMNRLSDEMRAIEAERERRSTA